MASLGQLKSAIFDREERKMQYQSHIRGLNAYDRHKKFMKDYAQFYGHEKNVDNSLPIKTDKDTLREGYRYCIADMTQYKKGKIGLRWRTEKEVISGKGQFICGNRHCDEKHGLGSYEVNFSYVEAGEQKQALVKLVACKSLIVVHYERCAEKLAYKRQKEKERGKEKELSGEKEIELKDMDKRKREHEESDATSDDEVEKDRRKKKDRKGASSRSSGNNDEGFEEFLEGMFP
ncbi:Protein FRA10AC1 [Dichanthelium oligosanthes]|uniref:Protein FRA10AC1 n=1 Tax=Dichanthelium oligosanthes TaxID=888268 RepID=A0A1E5UVP9_9POAL|nr:Protein FRA10AC1 [Dichanthelium oligosanthes]